MKFKNQRQHTRKVKALQRASERMERKESRTRSWEKLSNAEWSKQPRRWDKEKKVWLRPVVIEDKQTWELF